MAERVGKETVRLATTAGSEFCRLLLEPRAWDSKDRSYSRQQVLTSCDCQQAGFLERNLGIGEKALGSYSQRGDPDKTQAQCSMLNARVNRSNARTIQYALEQLSAKGSRNTDSLNTEVTGKHRVRFLSGNLGGDQPTHRQRCAASRFPFWLLIL